MEVTAVQTPQPKKKRRSLKLGGGLWPYAFLTPYIVCYAVFSLFPIVYSFIISLTSWEGIGDKVFVGFANYKSVLTTDPYFWKSIWNTIVLMVMSIPLSLVLGLLIAVFLFNLVRGRNLLQTLNFLPYVTTPVAIGLIFGFLFDRTSGTVNGILMQLGIINEGIYWLGQPLTARFVVAFMIIWKNTGYYMMLYLSGLASIPAELYEAAKVDGASTAKTFFHITLPMLRPITTFLMLTAFINGLQLFDEANLLFSGTSALKSLIGGPERSCLTAVWNFYDVSFKSTSRLGYGASIAFCLFIIIAVCTIINFKLQNRGADKNG